MGFARLSLLDEQFCSLPPAARPRHPCLQCPRAPSCFASLSPSPKRGHSSGAGLLLIPPLHLPSPGLLCDNDSQTCISAPSCRVSVTCDRNSTRGHWCAPASARVSSVHSTVGDALGQGGPDEETLLERADLTGPGLPKKAPLGRRRLGLCLERQLRKPAFLSHEVFRTPHLHFTLRWRKALPGSLKLAGYFAPYTG